MKKFSGTEPKAQHKGASDGATAVQERETTKLVGQSIPRVDAIDKVLGKTQYPGDLSRPDMVFMKVLLARRPHARIKKIDSSATLATPGVMAVFTASDVPCNEYGLIEPDQPVLCGDVVRYIGDKVALVIAQNEHAAIIGRERLVVDYEDLPAITDPRRALDSSALILHAAKKTNLLAQRRIRKGNIESGFTKADVIVESEYVTPHQEHAYLQPEAGLAYLDEQGRVVIETAAQWSHDDRHQIAHALGLPQDQVRVIYTYGGGAFGGKEDVSIQIVLALAAWKLRKPVKLIWDRDESIIGHHKRHPYIIKAKWGATRDGKLTAIQMDLLSDAGAYASSSREVLNNATAMCTGPYECENVWVDSRAVYTNNPTCGAFRGFGAPQVEFAAEMQMNKLAEALDMDSVELRKKNLWRNGSIQATGAPVPEPVGVIKVLEAAARAAAWPVKKSSSKRLETKKRGFGVACGFKNVGYGFGFDEKCTVTLELHGRSEIEKVVVRAGASDAGQGAHTILTQFVADALDVPLEKIQLVTGDTSEADPVGSCSASRLAFMLGQAVRGAAELAKEKWRTQSERPVKATYRFKPRPTTPLDPETGRGDPAISYCYAAQIAEVEVDTATGQVTVLKLISAHDVGKAVNPQQLIGQIEGGAAQGLGWATVEHFVMKDGFVMTPNFTLYLIPTVLDVPEIMNTVVLEDPDPQGPQGARGVGEMGLIPAAPALVAAVHDATGVWFDQLPLTPERVLKGLQSVP
ncbi:xanthine dehydrogenase family protein [Candidatus Acetothermia bacterium]|nr:xanthine dehydrogenase family protein [Candidatus Acetothermia bacterium]